MDTHSTELRHVGVVAIAYADRMAIAWEEPYWAEGKDARGRWIRRVHYRLDGGKRQRLQATGATKAEARAALTARMDDIAAGPGSGWTVARVWDDWKTRAAPSPQTLLVYDSTYRGHVGPVFGDRDPASLTRSELHAWVHDEPHTIGLHPLGVVLATICKRAVTLGIAPVNVTAGGLETAKRNPAGPNPLDAEALGIMEAAFDPALHDRSYDPGLLLDVWVTLRDSGLRIGEALALRVMDYDTAPRVLTVRGTMARAVSDTGGETYKRKESGKTAAATRSVTLPAPALLGHSAAAALARRAHGKPGDPLFPSESGTFISPANFASRWRRARPEGLEDVTPHTLRDTVATLLVRDLTAAQGLDAGLTAAAGQLGHRSARTLLPYIARDSVIQDNSAIIATLNPGHAAAARLREDVGVAARALGIDHEFRHGALIVALSEPAVRLAALFPAVEFVTPGDPEWWEPIPF